MLFKNMRKSKGIFLFIVVLLILAAGSFLFLKFKPAKERPQKLNAYTKEVITKYASGLVSNIAGITEPFDLDSNTENTIQDIISALETQDKVVIFNGRVFSDLEVVEDLGTYYLKPIGFDSYDYNDYLEVIRKEDVKPQEFYDVIDNPIQREVIKIFYEDFAYGEETPSYPQSLPQESSHEGRQEYSDFISDVKSALGLEEEAVQPPVRMISRTADLETRLRSFLDLKVREGMLSEYDYNAEHDSLTLVYGGEETPWLLNPSLYAQAIDYVITAYSDPRKFSQNTLEEYSQKLDRGDVLVVNTKVIPAFYDFFDRDILKDNLNILVDDSLSKDQKIEGISGGILYIDPDESPFQKMSRAYPTLNTDIAWADESQGEITQLLNRERVITPPSKDIYIVRLADYIPSKEIKRIKGESDRDLDALKATFYPYIRNGYNIQVLTYRWADRTIEKLAEILSNQKISIVVLDTHGVYSGDGTYFLYGELYDASTKDAESIFDKRLEQLWTKPYGGDGIVGYYRTTELSGSDKYILFRHDAGLADAIKAFFKLPGAGERKFGVVAIKKDFFKYFFNENSPYKKAVFISYVCYSWELTDSINARVFLAPSKGSMATREHFIESDLTKLAPYLLKKEDPGPVEITDENMRNYDILKSFRQGQILEHKDFRKDKWKAGRFTCVNQKDRLCNMRLFSPYHGTVSVSPHVQYAGLNKIEFNVPMDNSIPAETVVTIDCSECEISKKELAKLKPEWSEDKVIILPWEDKIYRGWQSSDDPNNTALAKITVHNSKAVSKISQISLTGNPDCCVAGGCKVEECWEKPYTIKYNGNYPKTDFIYFMPCLDIGRYYQACKDGTSPKYIKIIDEKGEYPEYIMANRNCYQPAELSEEEKKKAKPVQAWGKADDKCQQECELSIPIDCSNAKISGSRHAIDMKDDGCFWLSDEFLNQMAYLDCVGEKSCHRCPPIEDKRAMCYTHPKIGQCGDRVKECSSNCHDIGESCQGKCDPYEELMGPSDCEMECIKSKCNCYMSCLKGYSTCCK